MVETRQSVGSWSSCGIDGTTIDLSASDYLPTGEQVAFEVRYEEVMDLLKESMHDRESRLARLLEYENLHQVIFVIFYSSSVMTFWCAFFCTLLQVFAVYKAQ